MNKITIPAGTESRIRIPAKSEKPQRRTPVGEVERIGVSLERAAAMLGVSAPTVRVLIDGGSIRCARLGKRCIVSVQSLRDFVDGKKEPCDSERSRAAGLGE